MTTEKMTLGEALNQLLTMGLKLSTQSAVTEAGTSILPIDLAEVNSSGTDMSLKPAYQGGETASYYWMHIFVPGADPDKIVLEHCEEEASFALKAERLRLEPSVREESVICDLPYVFKTGLPGDAEFDPDNIVSYLESGVLVLLVPKMKKSTLVKNIRRITVKVIPQDKVPEPLEDDGI